MSNKMTPFGSVISDDSTRVSLTPDGVATTQNNGNVSVGSVTGSPTITSVGADKVYQWLNDGSITFNVGGTVEYLVVGGGGGGGGCDAFRNASGGGAGGMLSGTFTAAPGTYNITVGLGGAGGSADGTSEARSGGNSSVVGVNAPSVAFGGGRGDQQTVDESNASVDSPDGGSGGGQWFLGGGGSGTPGQGNDGARYGGGGAGEVGGTDGTYDGGDGLSNSITGSAVFYAGGGAGASAANVGTGGEGGGGNSNTLAAGSNGTDGLGGGGGAGSAETTPVSGGDGGDGTVILRFTPNKVAVITEKTGSVVNADSTTADKYAGLADTHLRESDANIAQGSNFNSGILEVTKYNIGDENRTLIRADGLSNIPQSATVHSAKLYLFQTGEDIEGYDVSLRRMLQSWSEDDATWNQYDSTLTSPAGDWNTAGAAGDGTDREATDSSITFVGRDLLVYHPIECTSIVQSIVDKTITTDEGFLLFRTSGGNNNSFKVFASSQNTDDTRKPELVVEYTVEAYGTTLTAPTVTGTHTDFVSVITEADLPTAMIDGGANSVLNGGGNLVAYTDSSRTTRLPIEVVSFVTGGTPSVEVWVKRTMATGNTIYLEADTTQTAQPAVTDTFGRNAVWSDYEFVYHDGGSFDSTGNTTPTYAGSITTGTATGKIGSATDFDGIDDIVGIGDIAAFTSSSDINISAWVNFDTIENDEAIIAKWQDDDISQRQFLFGTSGTDELLLADNSLVGVSVTTSSTANLTTGTDYHMSVDWDLSANAVCRVNNTTVATLALDGNIIDGTTGVSFGGRFLPNGKFLDAKMSEVRGRASSLSPDYTATEYDNQDTIGWWTNDGWSTPTSDPTPTKTGSIGQTLSALTQSASGNVVNDTIAGSIGQTLSALTQSASGNVTAAPAFTTNFTILPKAGAVNFVATNDFISTGGYITDGYSVTASPTKTGSIDQILSALTQSASGNVVNDTISGTIDQTLSALTQSASGNVVNDSISGPIAQTLSALTQSASGNVVNDTISGTIDQTLSALTQSASGNVVNDSISGPIAQTLPLITQSVSGDVIGDTRAGSIDQTLSSITQSATGTKLGLKSGTIEQTLSALNQSASGNVIGDTQTGSITQTLSSVTQSASGTSIDTIVSGNVSQSLQPISQNAAGLVADDIITGPISQTLPSITQNATGLIISDSLIGNIDQTLPSISQSMTGSILGDSIDGNISQSLSALTQTLTGSVSDDIISASIAQTLPAITQSAVAAIQDAIDGPIVQTLKPVITSSGFLWADPPIVIEDEKVCLGLTIDDINIFVYEDPALLLTLDDTDDIQLSLNDEDDLSLLLNDEMDITLSLNDEDDLALLVNDSMDILLELTDVTIITAVADEGEAEVAFAQRIDTVSDSVIYRGEAAPGTAESDAGWRIRRITFVVDGQGNDDTVIEWAGGSDVLDKIWDNRLTYLYS